MHNPIARGLAQVKVSQRISIQSNKLTARKATACSCFIEFLTVSSSCAHPCQEGDTKMTQSARPTFVHKRSHCHSRRRIALLRWKQRTAILQVGNVHRSTSPFAQLYQLKARCKLMALWHLQIFIDSKASTYCQRAAPSASAGHWRWPQCATRCPFGGASFTGMTAIG